MDITNLKPFNLQEALAGKPVMMRDGSKAYVRHHETELPVAKSMRLVGFAADGCQFSWCEDGSYSAPSETSVRDIVGMYPQTHIVNGFEVPAPETQAPDERTTYYFPVLHTIDPYGADEWYRDEEWHKRYLKRGLVFLNKEDAVANAKAMLGIDPKQEKRNEG